MQSLSGLEIGTIVQLIVLASGGGALIYQIRTNTKARETYEEKFTKALNNLSEKLEMEVKSLTAQIQTSELRQSNKIESAEEKFVSAVNKLGDKLAEALEGIRDVVSDHRARIAILENTGNRR